MAAVGSGVARSFGTITVSGVYIGTQAYIMDKYNLVCVITKISPRQNSRTNPGKQTRFINRKHSPKAEICVVSMQCVNS